MKKRSPVLVLLFSLITCGIYYLYWYVVTTNEIEHELKNPDGSCKSGGMTILFMIITCGIYTFYWWFKQGKRKKEVVSKDLAQQAFELCRLFFKLAHDLLAAVHEIRLKFAKGRVENFFLIAF